MLLMKSGVVAFSVLAVFLVLIAVTLPFVAGDNNKSRLKAVRARRDQYRDDLTAKKPVTSSMRDRMNKKSASAKLSDRLNLRRFFDMQKLKAKLMIAGWRDPNTMSKFLVVHLILPFAIGGYVAWAAYGGPLNATIPPLLKPLAVAVGGIMGLALPSIMVSNAAQNRQKKLTRQFPDALDLMLVCVEAGLSIEQAFMRITEEIGDSIPEVAEEFALTGAELAFLGERPLAYANLVMRTQMPEFKGLATALSQSEAYGTSVGTSLRALSEDSRKMRVLLVEKKAGGLSPKLTIPMILFVLPCMFMVLIGPSVIQVMALK